MNNNTTNTNGAVGKAGRTHIYILLDRSGSMEEIRDDVIGGFNAFIEAQRDEGEDAKVTLVQFDTQVADELVIDHTAIKRVAPLTRDTFVPRGGTPLLDATGLIIARAQERSVERKAAGKAPEDIVMVTITDGQENSSREFTRQNVLDLVKAREAEGWTFVFLSAGLAAYDEASGIGYDPRSVQAFAPDAGGAASAFQSLSVATARRRRKSRAGESMDRADFFEGDKGAEVDRDS